MLTYNSEKWLKDVLPPLQDSHVRLIVVDGSTDNTVETVLKYFPDAIIIKDKSNNLAYLRNLALRESEKHPSDYTAFIDSDMIVPNDFFNRTISLLEKDRTYGAVCLGGILNFEGKTFTAKFWRNFKEQEGVFFKDYVCTGSTIFKTEAVKGIVIDERCKRSDEDVDLCLSIRRRGYKILLLNEKPLTVHIRPATIKEELKRYVNFGKTRPVTLLKQDKNIILHAIFTDAFTYFSIISLFFIPFYGWICLLPIAIIFVRHALKLKRKWRIDHILFSMLLSYVYNCLCGVGLIKYGVMFRRGNRK
jgi:glycosyltransferase involved in cell wall biosynthesis